MELYDAFRSVKTLRTYDGYRWEITDIIMIAVLGSFSGFKSSDKVHQWAAHERTREYLRRYFGIRSVPCYSWFMKLLGIIDPQSLNEHFEKWVRSLLLESLSNYTLSFDGKTVRSTCKMETYEKPLHIISAQIAELGLTLSQIPTDDKSNEITAVRSLLKQLEISGCMVVADALNCQKETAELIVNKEADYLLCVKGNQESLEKDIEDYIQDDDLRKEMDTAFTTDLRSDRIERRTGYVTSDIDWLPGKSDWLNPACIGAIHTVFDTKKGVSSELHYYISSRALTAEELLHHARSEWKVESMHWLLDVHFQEDSCRVYDKNVQQTLNIIRKIVLNCIRDHKNLTGSDKSFSSIMQDCLLDPELIITF